MKRAEDMAARLPSLYREGELVVATLSQPAVQVEIIEEELLDIQRAHHFDAALELEDAAKLAALLDFVPEPWQNLALFRSWVHSQRNAALQRGAVTAEALLGFAQSYTDGYQDATNVRFHDDGPVLVENPPRRQWMRPGFIDNITPLTQFTIANKGLDDSSVSFLLTGLPDGPESVPVIVNLTTGEGLMFQGNVGPGQRLWLRAREDGAVEGTLERQDVTDRLRSIASVVPGEPWTTPQVQSPARALRLMRGENRIWFLPVAHYDLLGLDRFLLALADLALEQGRWDEAMLDHSVFYQDAAVNLAAGWIESEPASIEVLMPTQSVRRNPIASGTADEERERLRGAIDLGVKRLKAAGVRSTVRALAFSEMQGQADYLTTVLPLTIKEIGSTGADSMPEAGGLFDVTGYSDSTFR
jgi:hypothetical protein